MGTKKVLDLRTSQSGCGDIRITFDGLTLIIEYEFSSGGNDFVGGVIFDNVIAYRFRDELHSHGFETSSYDAIIEIVDSDWIGYLLGDRFTDGINLKDSKHFAVLLSNNGYLEAVAESCREVKPRPGNF